MPRSEASLYLAKAVQFLDVSKGSATAIANDAAILNAIHAVISATDAICVAIVGQRSSDPDHRRAADLLEQVLGGSREVGQHAKQLRELLTKKSTVEYESRRATAREASQAVLRAERFVGWAKTTVDQAKV